MRALFEFLMKLARREKNVEQITRPITKIVRDLNRLADEQTSKAINEDHQAVQLAERAKARRGAADEAMGLANKYAKLAPKQS